MRKKCLGNRKNFEIAFGEISFLKNVLANFFQIQSVPLAREGKHMTVVAGRGVHRTKNYKHRIFCRTI